MAGGDGAPREACSPDFPAFSVPRSRLLPEVLLPEFSTSSHMQQELIKPLAVPAVSWVQDELDAIPGPPVLQETLCPRKLLKKVKAVNTRILPFSCNIVIPF